MAAQSCLTSMKDEAPDSRYTDNINGTITDDYTDLMWKKCGEGATYNSATGCAGTMTVMDWNIAMQTAAAVNDGNSDVNFGYTNWRLPNIKELLSLHRQSCTQPAMNISAFPQPDETYTLLWSSTYIRSSSQEARFFIFDSFGGDFFSRTNQSPSSVRLVRDPVSAISFLKGYDIYIMDKDGNNQSLVFAVNNDNGDISGIPILSPQGTKIAFEYEPWVTGIRDIYVIDKDGSNLTNITNHIVDDDLNQGLVNGNWSKDGTKLLFSSSRDYNDTIKNNVHSINIDGNNLLRLSTVPANHNDRGIWSPDGTKVIFHSRFDGGSSESDIYVVDNNGNNQVKITSTNTTGSHNTPLGWSFDGLRVFFASDSTGTFSFYSMDPDGNNASMIGNGFVVLNMNYSPDGTKIAYTGLVNDNPEVFVMNSDFSNKINLSNNSGYDNNPVWTSDGKRILFYSTRTGEGEIYSIDIDGNNLINLTNDPDNWDAFY